MGRRFSRRVFLGGALGSVAGLAQAGAPGISLRPRVRPPATAAEVAVRIIDKERPDAAALIREARLGGQVSYAVVDMKSGALLEANAAEAPMMPASVAKTVTTLYALDAVGPKYRFETRLLATGPITDGVLDGDLILAGGGDPGLDTDALAGMAEALSRTELREVRGKLRVWAGALPFTRVIDPAQPEQVGYNPSVSGLNLNYNRVRFEWKRAGDDYALTLDARTARYRPAVRVARISLAARTLPVYTYSDGGDHDEWTVARAALGGDGARWLPVRKPGAYAAEVFAGFARARGIALEIGPALAEAPGGRVLVTHKSPPLREILRRMLKYSTNLTAEIVGMTATARRHGTPLPLAASAQEMSRWARARLGVEGLRLVNHSGLSDRSRLTAEGLVRALAQNAQARRLRALLKPFPLGDPGDEGIQVVAKTGTLYFVSALAGYITTASGRELAFVIFTANPDRRDRYDPSTGKRPPGARGWTRRARHLQRQLVAHWGRRYGT